MSHRIKSDMSDHPAASSTVRTLLYAYQPHCWTLRTEKLTEKYTSPTSTVNQSTISLRYEAGDRYSWLATSLLHHPRLRHEFSALGTIAIQCQNIYLRRNIIVRYILHDCCVLSLRLYIGLRVSY
jgi:hypothetical protein